MTGRSTYAMKDLDYALALAAEAGIDAEGAALAKALFAEAIESRAGWARATTR